MKFFELKNILVDFELLSAFLLIACLSLSIGVAVSPAAGIIFGGVYSVAYFTVPLPSGAFGLNNSNNQSARESFRIAKDLFYNAFRNLFPETDKGSKDCRDFVNSRKLSQSEIRLEVELNTASNVFNFALTTSQQNSTGVIFNTENRLTMQDSLVCSEYGIFVGQPSSRTDTAWQLKTYGSQPTFAAADAAALNSTFFSHGTFRITANNDVVMPYRGLFNHWYRGQTQQTGAFGAGSPEDQIRGAEDAMITEEPNLLLIGSKGYIPQITLPTNLASAAAFMRAVVIFRGVLAQNSTSVS